MEGDGPMRPLRFRKSFNLSFTGKMKTARLYVTSLGSYQAYINGVKVGNHCMAPGWTSYGHRINYQVFDIAALIDENGPNVIGVEDSSGGTRRIYGDVLAILSQLEISSVQGEAFRLNSDGSWCCAPSAIIRSEIYDGELYDAREEQFGWNDRQNFDDTCWVKARSLDLPHAQLVAPNAPPVRVTEEVWPAAILTSKTGKTIIDFGQNLVGVLRIKSLRKPTGSKVTFTHAEVLENDWLEDVAAEQLEGAESIPTFVVPNALQKLRACVPQAVWDDVTVLTPWALYQTFGDVGILRKQYDSMGAWVDFGIRRGPDRLWDPELWQLGDWLDPTALPEEPGNSRTSGTFVADAYLVHVTCIIARVSGILERHANAKRYHADCLLLRKNFQEKYIAPLWTRRSRHSNCTEPRHHIFSSRNARTSCDRRESSCLSRSLGQISCFDWLRWHTYHYPCLDICRAISVRNLACGWRRAIETQLKLLLQVFMREGLL
ncbi:uncharacterized protein Z518_11161 [Rhinocladiella mackenziei CBS 650.93]|uniref:alpha-L-rhamnosidase n=1 Tax=Rhinocladiella mackenziei CBS 650.93 TaxID=1442369 RepID=A0A0D2I1Y0_9EURO|nr:uncharacterized protein Z518_11161 [Rhinocladiella mackenziei CBS 650.93]KIW99748.1 hypothetical protein Z518_11161 [Rhinocladiella mackenziei CBS 650.93]